MGLLQKSCILFACLILCMVDSRGIAGNVKLVAMNGNQYWFSSSSPYAPNLNFHLAYQYCRTLGLQLVVLETKEEVETISAYLNSGDGNYLNVNKYWTSGNKLGADSWIWMSSGEQMNSSFSDYWLKSGTGSSSDNPKQCMSMKAPISKRAIFSSEECNKSLPFICEQVRCLYYNYPVSLFPDPSDLRADLEDAPGTFSTPTESESRASPNVYSGDSIRSKNYISGGSGRTINAPALADIAAQESSRIDPSKIQRRITLRPVMTTYPYPPSYINSFYKYKSVDYALTSTSRPSFKKTTRESLWSPEVSSSNTFNTINSSPTSPTFAALTSSSSESVSGSVNKIGSSTKFSESTYKGGTTDKSVYITGKLLNPSNSTVSTSVETSVRSETNTPFTHTHLEIVTSRSASIDGEVVTDLNEDNPTTSTLVSFGGPNGEEFGMSTNPTVVFDDEQNNVGGEVDDGRALQTGGGKTSQLFYQGNGIRRPDTKSLGVTSRYQSSEEQTTLINPTADREAEASQTHSPASMKMYQFQRGKLPINWAKSGSSSVSIIASTNTGPSKIGLGPRLKFRNRN